MVSSQTHTFYLLSTGWFFFFFFFFTWVCYIVFVQITQEVFVTEEWVKEARNDVKNEVHLRLETERVLGAAKEENNELHSELIAEERERRSAEAGLKNTQTQAKDQRKLLYQTKIDLAISRQLVMELKANLQKAKEATQLAKQAAEAEKQASYLLVIEKVQARLTEELAEVCKDYCNVTWDKALNVAGVPIDSAWRQPGSIYYHPDIHKVPGAISSPPTLAPKTSEQPLTAQATLPFLEASKGPSQAGDQGQGADGAKDKGKGKGTKPPSEAKDTAKAKEAEAKAKEVEAKTKEANPKVKDAPTSQSSQKENPPPSKAKAQHLGFSYSFFCSFFFFYNDILSMLIMYSLFCLMKMFFFLSLVPLLYMH